MGYNIIRKGITANIANTGTSSTATSSPGTIIVMLTALGALAAVLFRGKK